MNEHTKNRKLRTCNRFRCPDEKFGTILTFSPSPRNSISEGSILSEKTVEPKFCSWIVEPAFGDQVVRDGMTQVTFGSVPLSALTGTGFWLSDYQTHQTIRFKWKLPPKTNWYYVNLVFFARHSKLRYIVCSLALSDSFIAGYQYIGAF